MELGFISNLTWLLTIKSYIFRIIKEFSVFVVKVTPHLQKLSAGMLHSDASALPFNEKVKLNMIIRPKSPLNC